jgi:hypothetical protein
MLVAIGVLFILTAGALLHDVPFLRFISAMMLISVGQTFLVLGWK